MNKIKFLGISTLLILSLCSSNSFANSTEEIKTYKLTETIPIEQTNSYRNNISKELEIDNIKYELDTIKETENKVTVTQEKEVQEDKIVKSNDKYEILKLFENEKKFEEKGYKGILKLQYNDIDVKVHDNGSFVQVVTLSEGKNEIKIDSQDTQNHDTVTYIINRVPPKISESAQAALEEFAPDEFIYATVLNNNTPLRAQPDEYAKRLTHLDKNTVLMINGKKGDYYRVSLSPAENAWVKADCVIKYSTINQKMLASASRVSLSEDRLYNYIKTDLSFQIPFKIVETDNGLTMELYNIEKNAADTLLFETTGDVKSLTVNSVSPDKTSTYYIELKDKLWGYRAYYDDNTLVLKIRKVPDIDKEKPLKNITIFLDAGHGGCDAGAIGPTGQKEKDINLDVVKKLKKVLEDEGAKVLLTREDDTNIPLYDRVKMIQDSDALISLSIHANALADGADPYVKHGTSVFYYNRESVELAKTMRDEIIKKLGTKDDGVGLYSLVMTRPSMPLSVLIEVAYMIHPEEYKLLLDENFRQKTAESIRDGLTEYLLRSVKP